MTSGDFLVHFWSVRGSIACPGQRTVRYGGNTSCIELRCGPYRLILDGGTGLRGLDASLADTGPLKADVLFTHTHLDHICGWPFFSRLNDPTTELVVRAGNLLPDHRIGDVLGNLLREPFFPVHADNLAARVDYRDFRAGESFEPCPGVSVVTARLNHPQGATGYRVHFAGKSVCYVTDTEHVPGTPDATILELIAGADVVIYDATYTDDEFAAHRGWGHSTWQEGARLCEAAGVGTYVVFHHDPEHDDTIMDGIAAAVEARRPGSVVAREGLTLRP